MTAPAVTTCVQCKAAPAVTLGLFNPLPTPDGRPVQPTRRPWCMPCAIEATNVLVPAGYWLTLLVIERPPALLVCEYGDECGRMAIQGRRHCTTHLRTIEEVYAGKQSGASVDHPSGSMGPEWESFHCPACRNPQDPDWKHTKLCPVGQSQHDDYGTPPMIDVVPHSQGMGWQR